MTDWIDEIEVDEDFESLYDQLKTAIYKSRTCKEKGFYYAMYKILDWVKDDEYNEDLYGPVSATAAKKLTKKRSKRDD